MIPSSFTSASPLSRMLAAMRVKSPFSHSSLFAFIGRLLFVVGVQQWRTAHASGAAVVGSMVVWTSSMASQGNPPRRPCSRMTSASVA